MPIPPNTSHLHVVLHFSTSSDSYNKLSVGAVATKSVLTDAGQKTVAAAKNVSSATAKKLEEMRCTELESHNCSVD